VAHLFRLSIARAALRLGVVGLAGVVATLALSVSAQAIVTTIPTESGTTSVGLQPRIDVDNASSTGTPGELPKTFNNEEGNPVLPHSNDYLIYWDPKGFNYHSDWTALIDTFMHNFGAESANPGANSLFTVAGQYTDKANEHALYAANFLGSYQDTEPYPAVGTCADPKPLVEGDAITCLTDRQIRDQLEHFIGTHELQKGMGTIYYLLTPPGVTVCVGAGGPTGHCSDSLPEPSESYSNSFCSYHSDISPTSPTTGDGNTILYAVIPWTAGGLGDYDLTAANRTPAYDCQDGGFNPVSHPEIEEPEHATKRSEKLQHEFETTMNAEEKRQLEEAEGREGPHQQEPNQTATPSADGSHDTGLADLIINQIAVEQLNTVTDPLLNAWQDSRHYEDTDECRNFFAPASGGVAANEKTDAGTLYNQTLGGGNYYINNAFNFAAELESSGVPCIPGINLVPSFTVPVTANAGELVSFDGMESHITLDAGIKFSKEGEEKITYPLFTWNFGDGSPIVTGYAPGGPTLNSPSAFTCNAPWDEPCAASTFHSYQYGGTYEVTLTVTDVAGDTASITHKITVVGPPPPPPPAPPAPPAGSPSTTGGSSAGSSSGSGGGSSSGTPTSPAVPGPVAKAVASSISLSQALHRGLLVNYSVNEQVAGRFEVLLETSTARRLGIKGSAALGLPAGSPPALIVGRALLVTTKGGHSAVRIKLAKSAAAHLKHVRQVKLMLRLIVRNAATQNPQSTTVLTTVLLHR
jgi:hypothetical protein